MKFYHGTRKPPIDVKKLVELVRSRPGIRSVEITKEIYIRSTGHRAKLATLQKLSVKLTEAGDSSPIFLQRRGAKRHWYTMEYAVRNGIEATTDPDSPKPTAMSERECETFAIARAKIDSLWLTPGSLA